VTGAPTTAGGSTARSGLCTLSTGTSFGDTIVSGSGPIGIDGWLDVNGDGRARLVAMRCPNGNAFGMTIVGCS
jgi:hypothetical protein